MKTTIDNILEGIEIEERSPKILQTFDQSFASLRKRGYERHLSPEETFAVLIDAEENPDSKYKGIAGNMLSGVREWSSLAMLRLGDTLGLYWDPNLEFRNGVYVPKLGRLEYSRRETFDVRKVPSEEFVSLERLPSKMVKLLYSRSYSKLPERIREGAGIWMPSEGVLRPCGRGVYGNDFGVYGVYDGGASRGVRERRQA
ncbi:MAG: hypothetical protein AABW87_02180 [Nanoarchaeota archaeon]